MFRIISAVLKDHNKKQPGKERVYLRYVFRPTVHQGKLRQEFQLVKSLGQKLAPCGLLNLLFYNPGAQTQDGTTYNSLVPSIPITH